MTFRELIEDWIASAANLRRFAAFGSAEMLEVCAGELHQALEENETEPLTIDQSVQESAYSSSQLRRLLSDGTVTSVGDASESRIRR